jgi:hypothetical protein
MGAAKVPKFGLFGLKATQRQRRRRREAEKTVALKADYGKQALAYQALYYTPYGSYYTFYGTYAQVGLFSLLILLFPSGVAAVLFGIGVLLGHELASFSGFV